MFESLAGKKFGLIYADPPWRYSFSRVARDAIEVQYPTMSLEEIMAMPVQDICEENCILYMWTTSPKLEEAFSVINAWGFKYVTSAIWDKESLGLGYYFRIQHEFLLVGKLGKISPPHSDHRIRSVIRARKSSKHSEKPSMHHILDKYHPELNKIELFARSKDLFMTDWEVWGNEV